MGFRVAYISYADYGGPLVHTKEFVKAFRKLVPDLITYCPFFDKDLSYGGQSGPETFINKLFLPFPSWARQFKLEFYQLRKLLRDLNKWRLFYKLYQQNRIDIIVLRCDIYVMGAIYAAVKQGIPIILESNGVLSKDKPDRVTQFYEKYIWKKAAGIFAVCEPLAKLLISSGAPEEKIRVITNGVQLEAFQSIDKSVVPYSISRNLDGKIIVGYVGTFTEYHDLTTLLDGFKQSLLSIPNLCLFLIGEGRNNPKIEKEAIRMKIEKKIIFTAKVPHEHIPTYLKFCHILALPLKQIYDESFHGAPIKLFEYMASQRPIIATEMHSIRQLLDDNAIFVPPGRADKWRDALISLATDRRLYEEKGTQAFEYLKKRGYTWEENARRVHNYCKEILAGANQAQ